MSQETLVAMSQETLVAGGHSEVHSEREDESERDWEYEQWVEEKCWRDLSEDFQANP